MRPFPSDRTTLWHTTKATASGEIAERVSKKLATEEKLIATYGGVRVKMDIDRYDLWSERHDIAVGDLWATYARYPHMPRLTSFDTLAGGQGFDTLEDNGGTDLVDEQFVFFADWIVEV